MPLTFDKKKIEMSMAILPMVYAFLLPISQKLSTLFLSIWLILALFNAKGVGLNRNKSLLIPVLYYLAVVVSFFLSDSFQPHFLEHKLPFLLIPLLFFLTQINESYKIKTLHSFVFGCLIAIVLCYLVAGYHSIGYLNGKLIFKPSLVDGFSTYNSIIYGGNYFFGDKLSYIHQTVYFSMYLSMAVIILIEYPFKRKLFNWLSILLLLLAISMVMNRASYIALLIIALYFAFFKLKSLIGRSVLFSVLILGGIIIYKGDPRLKRMETNIERYLEADDNVIRATMLNDIDRRFLIWYTSIQLIKNQPLFGVGIADVNTELNKLYSVYETKTLKDLNAHNLYLQVLLEFGIIGLILLISMLVFLWRARGVYFSERLVTAFLILLMINFLFESMFNRYSGISFVCFFYCLLTTKPR